MIQTIKWLDRDNAYYTQENNPMEQMLKKRFAAMGVQKGWLETCGPTAAVNCLASIGRNVAMKSLGTYAPQPEQVLADWFNDPANYAKMRQAWGQENPELVPGNEIAQWYPIAIKEVFGVDCCTFVGALTKQQTIEYLSKGCSIQVNLVNPGHFICVGAYDPAADTFYQKDSWSGRWTDGNGFNRALTAAEFETNTKPKFNVYCP